MNILIVLNDASYSKIATILEYKEANTNLNIYEVEKLYEFADYDIKEKETNKYLYFYIHSEKKNKYIKNIFFPWESISLFDKKIISMH